MWEYCIQKHVNGQWIFMAYFWPLETVLHVSQLLYNKTCQEVAHEIVFYNEFVDVLCDCKIRVYLKQFHMLLFKIRLYYVKKPKFSFSLLFMIFKCIMLSVAKEWLLKFLFQKGKRLYQTYILLCNLYNTKSE